MENISVYLGIPYEKIEGGVKTDTGVEFTDEELVEHEGEANWFRAEYEKRRTELLGVESDSVDAKFSRLEDIEDNEYTEYTEDDEYYNSCMDLRPESVQEKHKNKPELVVFTFVLTAISFGCMIMSTYYSTKYLSETLPFALALGLAMVMTAFSTSSLEIAVLFRQKKKYLSFTCFILMFILCVTYSMTNTMAVSFGAYQTNSVESIEENHELNQARMRLQAIEEQKEVLKSDIKGFELTMQKTDIDDWRYSDSQIRLSRARNKLTELVAEECKIASEMPEAKIIKETKKETFFDFVSKIIKVRADIVQFILSVIPAIMIDIIAPFAMTTALSLIEDLRKAKEV